MKNEKKKPYLVETFSHYGDTQVVTDYLEQKLADGWALVGVTGGTTFYFKAV